MRPPRTARTRPASERGFTLMEVLVALAIMSLVMVALYSVLNASLLARDTLEREARVVRVGPDILDLIEADLRRAWVMDIDEDQVFKGESKTIDGEPADALSFLTTVDSTVTRHVDEREVPSDICETGYRLRRNAALPDVRELWRRQSFHVDDKPLEDGVYELLHDRVISFQVHYFDEVDKDAEERTEWDAAVRHRLPALVQIDLALEAVPRTTEDLGRQDAASRVQHFRRMIALEPGSDLRLRCHAVVPTFVASGGTAGGGSNQGGNPDGDDDGDGTLNKDDPDYKAPGSGGPGNGGSQDGGNGGQNGGGATGGGGKNPGGGAGGGGSGGGGSGGGGGGGGGGDPLTDALNNMFGGGG